MRNMPETTKVAAHYTSGGLLDRIQEGLDRHGVKPPYALDTLALFDEFHIGGRQATEGFIGKLKVNAGSRILDLGCGLGGPARYVAKITGARVTGIDLTPEFVEAGRALTGLALMLDRVDISQGSVLDLPQKDSRFDAAYMIHVGMNIADKEALAREVFRVLKPGGKFGIYDVMSVSDEAISYPVPWASDAGQSALSSPEQYRDALKAAGFELDSETDQTGFAQNFFARLVANQRGSDGPPPLGLHLVMGPDTKTKVRNMIDNIEKGIIAPIEMIAHRPY